MFHVFFSVNYWITTNIFRNKEYPLFSVVVSVSLYQFLALLFIYDFVLYQIMSKRSWVIEEGKFIGYFVITALLVLNFYHYNYLGKDKKALDNFKRLGSKKKTAYKIFCIVYMALIITLTIYMSYSIRNNIFWFK